MEKKELLKNLSVFKNNIHIQNFSNKIINYDDKTLYFGTGLASCHESSIGFGIEILCTILTALWLKEKYGLTQVIHEISTIGYNISEENKKKLIVSEKKIIENMIKNLSLENDYKLNFSHEYHESEEFNDIKKFVTEKLKEFWANEKFSEIGNYTILQISGMKYLYENYNTRIKLGWITDKKAPLSDVTSNDINKLINESHLNEYYFDHFYKFVFPDDSYTFLYTPCAIEFVNGNRVVPYSVTKKQIRPILNNDSLLEFVNKIPDNKLKYKILTYWRENIVNLFEELFYKIPIDNKEDTTLETIEKLEYIKINVLNLK